MASVLNSKANFYRYDPVDSNEPDCRIESEADIFIKELSCKQLRTNTTLEEELHRKKEFISSHTYQPITEQASGELSLDDFKHISVDPGDDARKINYTCSKDLKHVSRHVRELAFAVKPNSTETKLLEFAISCNAVGQVDPDYRPADHPINKLQDIENQLFSYRSDSCDPTKTARTILRKRKQLLEAVQEPIQIKTKSNLTKGKSLWNVTESGISNKKQPLNKVYTCKKEKLFSIQDGKIIEINPNDLKNKTEPVYEKSIITPLTPSQSEIPTRLSEDEIRELARFRNYEKGIPTKTLYLKNLSTHMTEDDLSRLFGEFQQPDKPRITYNLMKNGKMRGQAFIHFHCIETATNALKKLNGCFVHGKPLIIQFSISER